MTVPGYGRRRSDQEKLALVEVKRLRELNADLLDALKGLCADIESSGIPTAVIGHAYLRARDVIGKAESR